jgi:cytochrome c oxidase subunit 2
VSRLLLRAWRPAPVVGLSAALVLGGLLVACGASSDGSGDDGQANGPQAAGQRLAAQKGCAGCHTPNGRPSIGPTWKGIFGSTVTLKDGSTAVVDQAYVERSIREPSAQIVDGFSVPMPRIALSDDEVVTLVEYIRSLA